METINIKSLSSWIQARKNCLTSGNTEWYNKWDDRINEECKKLPSGSGIDAGMKLLTDDCTDKKIIFSFGYHHMNENGFYDGWTEHRLIITPAFGDLDLRITGRDRYNTKDYLYDLFNTVFVLD